MRKKKDAIARVARPAEVLKLVARDAGCVLSSLGDTEQLAGIDVGSTAERNALWRQFQSLFDGPWEVLFEAVMDHCAGIALRRIEQGELCLLPTHYGCLPSGAVHLP